MAARRKIGATRIQWNPQRALADAKARSEELLAAAAELVKADWQRRLNRGQPVRTTSSGNVIGLEPSQEGEAPKRLTGSLIKSAAVEVTTTRKGGRARIGTALKYFRRLELGFKGTDGLGRNVSQGARPSLRPALKENQREIKKLFGVGKRRRGKRRRR